MSQSALTVGIILFAFLMFVTARGRLPTYSGILWGEATGKGGVKSTEGDGEKKDKGIDLDALGDSLADLLPFPFNLAYDVGDIVI